MIEPIEISVAPDYAIYRDGTIVRTKPGRCTRVGKVLKPWFKDGYPAICLRNDGRIVKKLVHILVCTAYHGPQPTPAHEVAHGDGVPGNCHETNLRWATHTENEGDKKAHGTYKARISKLSPDDVRAIRAEPRRYRMLAGLAEKYGVTQQTISKVRNPKSNYWITVPW